MYHLATAQAVLQRLESLVVAERIGAEDRDQLRALVFAVTDDLRAAGWTPERVIIGVKQIADDAGWRPSGHMFRIGDKLTSRDDALAEMVRWCIQRYYSTAS
jgi:hypothetical protein